MVFSFHSPQRMAYADRGGSLTSNGVKYIQVTTTTGYTTYTFKCVGELVKCKFVCAEMRENVNRNHWIVINM